jgi:lipid-A-disaccharide synthase
MDQKIVMIIAGEVSGDLHGAKLVQALRKKEPSLFFYGIGGEAMKNAGVRIIVDAASLSVVGITEVFYKMPQILKGMSAARNLLKSLKPDLLILIDFPDFNLHVAKIAKKRSVPVLYYISPQLWAWRPGRVKKIGERVDHMAVILPFETEFYRKHGIPVTFVGHPLLDTPALPKEGLPSMAMNEPPVVGLLPGSRDREIDRHLPILLETARALSERITGIRFLISLAPSVARERVLAIMAGFDWAEGIELVADGVEKVFEKSTLVVAASGTVTLEAAIYGTPMVIIYRVSPLSYWIGRALIRVKSIGLVNLIAENQIIPELIQDQATPEKIGDTVCGMMDDRESLDRIRKKLFMVRDILGGAGASARVADIAMGMLQK